MYSTNGIGTNWILTKKINFLNLKNQNFRIFYLPLCKREKFLPLQKILYKHNEHTVKK
jgi:hypothetical protein